MIEKEIFESEHIWYLIQGLKKFGLDVLRIREEAIKNMVQKSSSLGIKILGGNLEIVYTFGEAK